MAEGRVAKRRADKAAGMFSDSNSTSKSKKGPAGWGDSRFQGLYTNIMGDATNLTDPQNTPQLSDQYWNQMQDQAIQSIQGGAATQQNQVMEQLARRGLSQSGAAGAALASLANQNSANQSSVLRDFGLQRQQSELQNAWQARQHQLGAAGLGMQYSQAAQAARNAAAGRARAASQQQWNRQQQLFSNMGSMMGHNQSDQRANFNTEKGAWATPQEMALQQMGNAPPSNSGVGSFAAGVGGLFNAFAGNKGGGGGGSGGSPEYYNPSGGMNYNSGGADNYASRFGF